MQQTPAPWRTTLDDLLDGLEGDAREARGGCCASLLDDGCPIDELRQAVAEDRLVLLPVERALAGERAYTARELAERVGRASSRTCARRGRAFGLPRPPTTTSGVCDDADLEVAEGLKAVLDTGVPLERVVELNRVIGRAMVQVAAASRGDDRRRRCSSRARPSTTSAAGAAAAARELIAADAPDARLRLRARHLRELLRSDVISAADIAAGRDAGRARHGRRVRRPRRLHAPGRGGRRPRSSATVVGRLEDVAADLVERPVTFVKTIGDAVMLVAPDARPADRRSRCKLVDGGDLPQLRVGVALRAALERAGDWYGSPVNQASRVTAVARPGSVLVTEAVREAAERDWTWSYARERRLKGVGEVKLFRARASGLGATADVARAQPERSARCAAAAQVTTPPRRLAAARAYRAGRGRKRRCAPTRRADDARRSAGAAELANAPSA